MPYVPRHGALANLAKNGTRCDNINEISIEVRILKFILSQTLDFCLKTSDECVAQRITRILRQWKTTLRQSNTPLRRQNKTLLQNLI